MLVTRLVDCICHSGYMRSFASNLKYKYFIFKRLSCIQSRPEGGGGGGWGGVGWRAFSGIPKYPNKPSNIPKNKLQLV